ncbi:MAG: 3-oxoacyl-[acyl-carrier-protein] synthase III C-terminal domain-containing protein [Acidimicrobiia bacterium]
MHEPRAYLVGIGGALPPFSYTNAELAPYYNIDEATAERYARATGIESRHSVVDLPGGRRQRVLCETLASDAAKIALERAEVSPNDVDMVVTAASLFDYIVPALGSRLLKRLGIREALTFDLYGGCAQFMHGVSLATNYIKSGLASTVLVTASEALTSWNRGVRYPVDAFIFGDSGAAWVITSLPRTTDKPVWEIHETTAGTLSEHLGEPTEVVVQPITGWKEPFDLFLEPDATVDERMAGLHPDDRHEYRWIHNTALARRVAGFGLVEGFERVTKATEPSGGLVVPHQGTKPVLDDVAGSLPEGWTVLENLANRGNLSTACVPMAMYDHPETCLEHETIVATAVGVGFSFAAARLTRDI